MLPIESILQNPQRLAILQQHMLLDTPAEAAFDRLTRLAHQILKAPVSLISLVDADRQFFKSFFGLEDPWASRRETPLSHSFCQHSVVTGEALIIDDARQHPLVWDNLAIRDLNVIAYAGIPLISDGHPLGTFCIIDHQPRHWEDEEITILKDLAAAVMTEIMLRAELRERERIEKALRETEERYRALFERSHDAVFIHDFEGNFIDANNAALDLLGYSREEIPTLSFASLLETEQLPRVMAMLEEVQKSGSQENSVELRLKNKTGSAVIVDSLSSLITHEGKALAIQGIARDITQRKQAEEILQRAYEKEKELNQARSRFVSMLSHDFRLPLTIISTSSELLKNYAARLSEEKRQKHLVTIQNQVKRQLELLDDVLSISKAETAALNMSLSEINWSSFCADLVEELQITAGTNHRLLFSTKGEQLEGFVDEKLMRRALSNLLSNAIKYSPEGGEIHLFLYCEDEKVVLHIQDQGLGISEADQQRLFEPFYRAGNAQAIEGTGLGLVIVKQVVEAHKGSITVESHVGKGTVFTLTLPKFL